MKIFSFIVCVVIVFNGSTNARSQRSALSRISVTAADTGLHVSNIDDSVSGVRRGVCYIVLYDSAGGASVINPSSNGEATTDLGANITGDSGRNVLVQWTLPTVVTGTAGVIGVSFGPTSQVRIEDGGLTNPNVANTFNTGAGGAISLRLGFSFCVPVAALSGDTYVGTALCTVSYVDSPHTSVSAVSSITFVVASEPLSVSNISGVVSGVLQGVCYQVIYDAAGGASVIFPAINGEATTDLGANITGDPGQNVLVQWTLPTVLTGTAGTIAVSFPAGGQVRVEDGGLSNPNVPTMFNTGTGGAISLRLGFSFCVPASAAPGGDTFSGRILAVASYEGSPDSSDSAFSTITVIVKSPPSSVSDIIYNDFELMQNYPNPFNPTTVIRYQLPARSHVILNVYNLLGQKVAVLVDQVKTPGTYSVIWDATGLTSGLYICRLVAGAYSQTQKLLLSK